MYQLYKKNVTRYLIHHISKYIKRAITYKKEILSLLLVLTTDSVFTAKRDGDRLKAIFLKTCLCMHYDNCKIFPIQHVLFTYPSSREIHWENYSTQPCIAIIPFPKFATKFPAFEFIKSKICVCTQKLSSSDSSIHKLFHILAESFRSKE